MCIQDTIQTMESTNGKPFNPKECVHLLVGQILTILVRTTSIV